MYIDWIGPMDWTGLWSSYISVKSQNCDYKVALPHTIKYYYTLILIAILALIAKGGIIYYGWGGGGCLFVGGGGPKFFGVL